MGSRVLTLVAVDAILALSAGLAGRPLEALSTLTHARAVHSVQADRSISPAPVGVELAASEGTRSADDRTGLGAWKSDSSLSLLQ